MSDAVAEHPSNLRLVLGFLAVGLAWGFTTPFMRQAALQNAKAPKAQGRDVRNVSVIKRTILNAWDSILDLVSRPAYLIPFLLNLSGSVWFFLLVGQAELSLSVPITNSCAFLFTVLGEWWAEGKTITRETFLGMVLVVAGIGLCVHAKSGE